MCDDRKQSHLYNFNVASRIVLLKNNKMWMGSLVTCVANFKKGFHEIRYFRQT